MAWWIIGLSYGAKEIGEVNLENCIIEGDTFSPLLFVLMTDDFIKTLKRRLDGEADVLSDTDDLRASMSSVDNAKQSMPL